MTPVAAPPALLVLEDGTAFLGRAFAASGEAFGEVVFNTAMSGYQEVLTDPSYAQQIVVMTSPHQGNYGVNGEDVESGAVQVSGFVVREASRRPSSWRARASLPECLRRAGVVGLEGIDTRALTRRIRDGGAVRAGISTVDLDPLSLASRVRGLPPMEGTDLARWVSTRSPYPAREVLGPADLRAGSVLRVAAYDFGLKRSLLRLLDETGCDTTIVPATTPPGAILSAGFEGVFLSNGPGDPAATRYGVDAVRGLLGRIPIFGVCLGHQLLALALGGRTYKLKFGHRGVNQPVKDLDTGRVEISSHNHGFTVDVSGWNMDGRAVVGSSSADPPVVKTDHGGVALTHWNLNDGTLEGLRCMDIPAFSVQFHPEAAPGPHESRHLFARFRDLMA